MAHYRYQVRYQDDEDWKKLPEDYQKLLLYGSYEGGVNFEKFLRQLNKILDDRNKAQITAYYSYNRWQESYDKAEKIDPELVEVVGNMWIHCGYLRDHVVTEGFKRMVEKFFSTGRLTKAAR